MIAKKDYGTIQKDAELWKEFKNGNRHSFELMYKTWAVQLIKYGKQIHGDEEAVKDAIQEIFIGLWNNRSNLSDVQNIRSYLFKCLRSHLFKTAADKNTRPITEHQYISSCHNSPEAHIISKEIRNERKKRFRKAIKNLSPKQREILYLVYYINMKPAELSEVLSVRIESVYTLTWKAIRSVKNYLDETYEVPSRKKQTDNK